MDHASEKEQGDLQISRRDFLKFGGAWGAGVLLKKIVPRQEDQPPPPKENYTQQEWFAIRSLPEGALDSVVKRGFAGIGLPVIKSDIAVIEGQRYTKELPLAREFPTYSLTEVRQILRQLNSSVLFDVTPFFMPQWDPAYVLPVSRRRVDIDPETGVERPNPDVTQWEQVYISDDRIRLGRGSLGESWRLETTEGLPPDKELKITWVGKRTPFKIDATGKLEFDPSKSIAFYSEARQDRQGSYYEMFSGVSPTGVLYLPVEMSMTLKPQPMAPKGLEA